MQLKLGQAFALACLIEYGPLLPAESSGHLDKRKALFRSAAWYSLSDEELDRVLQHREVAPYLYSMVNQAKQYKYAIFKQARRLKLTRVHGRCPTTGRGHRQEQARHLTEIR